MESRGVESLKARLREEAAEAQLLERHLAAVRRRRDELATKLTHCGLSRRAVAKIAGVSDVALIYSERKRKVPKPRLGRGHSTDGKSARTETNDA